MDEKGRTRGTRAAARPRGGVRMALGVAGLGMVTTAVSGCTSLAVEKAIGPDPRSYPPVVERYEWAGHRGDELVVVYRVWGGHPRRHETRWTALDLRSATWAVGLGAPRVGEIGDRVEPIPERASTEPVPVVPLFGPLQPEVANARDDHRPAGRAAVALYARGGSAPELIVVTRDGAGELRSASWALRPTEDPGSRRVGAAAARAWGGRGGGRGNGAASVVASAAGGGADPLTHWRQATTRDRAADAAAVSAGGGGAARSNDA